MLSDAGADNNPPTALFRNIWDPDELDKLIQTSERCINTTGVLGRRYRRFYIPLLYEAALQFKNMGQSSSAEGMKSKALRELEEYKRNHERSSPPHESDNQPATTTSQAVTRSPKAFKHTSSERLEESDSDQIPVR